jgi:cytochrome o ubiquinol oxidase operon protein cyoD
MTPNHPIRADFLTYGIGYVLAILLTGAAFALVYFHVGAPVAGFAVILLLGLVQIVVHMRCFLHMSLQRSARSDLMLVLFSVLIIAVMVSGTLVILFNLRTRMM